MSKAVVPVEAIKLFFEVQTSLAGDCVFNVAGRSRTRTSIVGKRLEGPLGLWAQIVAENREEWVGMGRRASCISNLAKTNNLTLPAKFGGGVR